MNVMNISSDSTSVSLIERARNANAAAWQRLSSVYGPLVYRWCRRSGLQDADSADVVQEVFQAVHRKLETFVMGRTGGFRGWLHGITRHKLADHFRRGELTQQIPLDVNAVASFRSEEPLSDISVQDSLTLGDDLALVLHATLDAIREDFDPRNWEVFERTVLHNEPAVKVAEDLNISSTSVRQAKFRILCRLRRELGELSFIQSKGKSLIPEENQQNGSAFGSE